MRHGSLNVGAREESPAGKEQPENQKALPNTVLSFLLIADPIFRERVHEVEGNPPRARSCSSDFRLKFSRHAHGSSIP